MPLGENAIEARHLEAIDQFGHDPGEFAFARQLERLRSRDRSWSPQKDTFWRSYESWSPSRFELIELLPLYAFADGAVRTMRTMSADRRKLPDVDFVIATEPSKLVTASIDDIADDEVTLDGSLRRIVWMNLGLMNFFKDLARHCTWCLVRMHGDLDSIVEGLARRSDEGPAPLVSHLLDGGFDPRVHQVADPLSYVQRDRRPPDDSSAEPGASGIHPSDPASEVVYVWLLWSLTTFVAGHEIGHVYLGQTRSQPPIPVLLRTSLDARTKREVEADATGLDAVWDGLANAQPRAAIDVTWMGPVLFLASQLGVALAREADDSDALDYAQGERAVFWRTRLYLLVMALMQSLVKNQFPAERVRRIGLAVPPLASAVVEWIRATSVTRRAVIDNLAGSIHDELRELVLTAQQ